MWDYKPDQRVECTVGLNKSHTQEPVIVVFHCLSYTNGDRLRQAMPEGCWSLSTLPGKGLLVGMGFGRKPRIPAWPSAKSELRGAGLDLSLNNNLSPEPLKGNHFHHGLLLLTSQPGLPLCVHV